MERKIESLLRLVADMKQFEQSGTRQSEEMSMEELDLIAAAGNPDRPRWPWEEE